MNHATPRRSNPRVRTSRARYYPGADGGDGPSGRFGRVTVSTKTGQGHRVAKRWINSACSSSRASFSASLRPNRGGSVIHTLTHIQRPTATPCGHPGEQLRKSAPRWCSAKSPMAFGQTGVRRSTLDIDRSPEPPDWPVSPRCRPSAISSAGNSPSPDQAPQSQPREQLLNCGSTRCWPTSPRQAARPTPRRKLPAITRRRTKRAAARPPGRSKTIPPPRFQRPAKSLHPEALGCKEFRRELVACFCTATLAWNSTGVDTQTSQLLQFKITNYGTSRSSSMHAETDVACLHRQLILR
jgi:hypothetical protein